MTNKARCLFPALGGLCLLAWTSSPMASDTLEDVPAPQVEIRNFYRVPSSAEVAAEDKAKSCRELETEISELMPLTYNYKPGFYEDPAHGVGTWLAATTTYTLVGYGIFGYSGFFEFQEKQRINTAQDRIEQLRRLKAQQHCFET